MATRVKTAKTLRAYEYGNFHGWKITVPAGSVVCNRTARGPDDSYRFWHDFQRCAEELAGGKNSILEHFLDKYGINVPAEYCEPYDK